MHNRFVVVDGYVPTLLDDTNVESLGPCIQHVGIGSAAAIAFCDERVYDEPSPDLADRFREAQTIADSFGVRWWDVE
jgi:hypothetical protein